MEQSKEHESKTHFTELVSQINFICFEQHQVYSSIALMSSSYSKVLWFSLYLTRAVKKSLIFLSETKVWRFILLDPISQRYRSWLKKSKHSPYFRTRHFSFIFWLKYLRFVFGFGNITVVANSINTMTFYFDFYKAFKQP